MHSVKHDISQDEHRDAINLLYSNSFSGFLVSLLASFVLVFGFDTSEIQNLKHWWLGVFVTCLILRFIDAIYWKIKLSTHEFSYQWPLMRFGSGVILTAILWSSYAILVVKQVEVVELAYTLIIIAALAAGSITVLAGSKIIATSYSSILVIPPSLYMLSSDEKYDYLLGWLGLVSAFVMIVSAIRIANFTKDAIHLKNHNRLLVNDMRIEKKEVTRINAELSIAYKEINENNNRLEQEVAKRTEQIHQLSNLDPLTKLYNRNAFIYTLNSLLAQTRIDKSCLAVLFVDLDRFKRINDALGHEVGDEVLKVVTQRIQKLKPNGNVGRWGGDEFVLALPNCDEKQAKINAMLIIESIASTIKIGSLKLNVGASIGIALSPKHGQEEKRLIQYADIAMFKQKESREKLPQLFSNDLLLELQKKERLQEGLRQAIRNNEFHITYQPIMNASGTSISSCEALLRWTFNQKTIPPEMFIGIAEQSGLISEIGRWVICQACLDAVQWNKTQVCKVSVNVSMAQLLDRAFISYLDEALEQSQLPPNLLALEITESTLSRNQDRIKKLLVEIKSRKIGVSIDDFGTGYSSMSQLQSLPFDTIKIDRSFVARLHDKGDAIVKATLFIAREFNCQCVAEGVETIEQAKTLNTLGVDYLQGFLYSKPLRLPELLEHMNITDAQLMNKT